MPRPKGSKNKKNRTPAENLDALIAQKQEEKAALEAQRDEIASEVEAQKNELKAVKAELKKIDKALAGCFLQEQNPKSCKEKYRELHCIFHTVTAAGLVTF